jgi:hypothetical protein
VSLTNMACADITTLLKNIWLNYPSRVLCKILSHSTKQLYEPIRGAWLCWVKIPNIAVAASNVFAWLPGRSTICPLDFVFKPLSPNLVQLEVLCKERQSPSILVAQRDNVLVPLTKGSKSNKKERIWKRGVQTK